MDTGHGQLTSWHTKALPRPTQKALDYLSKQQWLKKSHWYLAGGTALALQEGHRSSVDLDFFSPQREFVPQTVINKFTKNIWTTDILRENTLYGRIHDAKISFIAYPFFVSKRPPLWYGTIRMLDKADIAVIKIIAISQRGKKRDFLDLFWYCQHHESLHDIMLRLSGQYPTVAHDFHHILKSLTYFEDAEKDPMPKLYFKTSWPQIKKYFQKEVPAVLKKVIGLP